MKYTNISIKRLASTGPSEHSTHFRDSRMLINFLGRKTTTYVSEAIRNRRYIIRDTSNNYYVIISYNGYQARVGRKLKKFYDSHAWKNGVTFETESLVMPTKEQTQENKIRHVKVGKLLSLIQVKYGGVFKAEGTKEFLELQKLLNVGSND